ncbi:MAG: MarC family protein [Nitrospiraceae bacterium]|nr:MAG: MarC family protein [Nitrospiraceae bacterium]
MPDILKDLPLAFIPLFVAMDPFGMLPLFTALTRDMSVQEKKDVIKYSTLTALVVSIAFAFIGDAVFAILGITVSDFKIAGGLLLLVIAVLELVGRGCDHKKPEDVGIVPLGVPLLVGPAVLTLVIVLIDNYGIMLTLASLVLNLMIVFAVFTAEQPITKFIGKNGLMAISKIVALLLAAIAVMMIRRGLEQWLIL